jgi:hypothetical protein
LWDTLKAEVSINNPYTKEELKKRVLDVEHSVSPAEPQCAMNIHVRFTNEMCDLLVILPYIYIAMHVSANVKYASAQQAKQIYQYKNTK